MSIPNIFSLVAYFTALFVFTPLLGSYMARALSGEKVFLSPFFLPCERFIYKICLIDPHEEMHWKKYANSLIWISVIGIAALFVLQIAQHHLPLNPQGHEKVPWALALNTAVSFVTNTNWQAYAGESVLSYAVQMLGLTVQNFMSASVGIAVLLAIIRGLQRKNVNTIGNFWSDVVRSFLYVLLPLSLIVALFLLSQGVVQNFSSYVTLTTVEGGDQILPTAVRHRKLRSSNWDQMVAVSLA